MEKIMNKLVRDKIPEIILANGEEAIYHRLNEEEYIEALKVKLKEEYEEVREALTKEEVLEECADMLEVIGALVEASGFSEEDLIRTRNLKREKRGGFKERIFLEKTK